MKNRIIKSLFLILAVSGLFLTSCKEETRDTKQDLEQVYSLYFDVTLGTTPIASPPHISSLTEQGLYNKASNLFSLYAKRDGRHTTS